MSTLGDFDTSTVVRGKFTTYRPSTGAPFTLGGTPALSVYKDNGTTQSNAGVTLTADFDAVTGLNHYDIDTSADGTFYSAGSFYDVVITTGTVDSVSAVGTVVGRFTLRKTSDLKPTVAGRSIDISAGGEAGVDWSNVGSPTTVVNLSGTSISTSQVVASVTGAVGSVTGAVTVGTNNDKTGYSLSGSQTFNLTGSITGNLSGSVGSVTGNVGGNVVGSVGSVTTGVTVTTNNDKTGYRLSSTGVDDVLRSALTEGYAVDGATFTLEQAMYMMWSLIAEKNITSTTLTAKRLDGSTTAMTFSLNDATNPTSITRTS